MKCTDRDITIMLKAFDETQNQVNLMLYDYRKNLIETTKGQELKTFRDDSFFRELGKEAVLFKIDSIYKQEVNMRDLINNANDILGS